MIPMNARDLEEALEMGMDWSLREGYIWAEDKEHCEEYGRMLQADPTKVSARAKKRGQYFRSFYQFTSIKKINNLNSKYFSVETVLYRKYKIILTLYFYSLYFDFLAQ